MKTEQYVPKTTIGVCSGSVRKTHVGIIAMMRKTESTLSAKKILDDESAWTGEAKAARLSRKSNERPIRAEPASGRSPRAGKAYELPMP